VATVPRVDQHPSSSPSNDPRAREIEITAYELIVTPAEGRRIATPLAWFPRLLRATPAERGCFEILGDGVGIHWPDIDEDISADGMLRGTPSAAR